MQRGVDEFQAGRRAFWTGRLRAEFVRCESMIARQPFDSEGSLVSIGFILVQRSDFFSEQENITLLHLQDVWLESASTV